MAIPGAIRSILGASNSNSNEKTYAGSRKSPDQAHEYVSAIITYTKEDTSYGEDKDWLEHTTTGNTIKAYLPENFNLQSSSSFDQPFAQGFIQNESIRSLAQMGGYSLTTQSMSVHSWQGSAPLEFSLTFVFIAENDPISEVVIPVATLTKLERPGRILGQGGMLVPPGPRVNLGMVPDLLKTAGSQFIDVINSGLEAGAALLGTAAPLLPQTGVLGPAGRAVKELAETTTKPLDLAAGALKQSVVNLSNTFNAPVANPANNISLQIGNLFYFKSVFIESVSQTYDTVIEPKTGKPLKTQVDVTFKTFTTPTKSDINGIFRLGGKK